MDLVRWFETHNTQPKICTSTGDCQACLLIAYSWYWSYSHVKDNFSLEDICNLALDCLCKCLVTFDASKSPSLIGFFKRVFRGAIQAEEKSKKNISERNQVEFWDLLKTCIEFEDDLLDKLQAKKDIAKLIEDPCLSPKEKEAFIL